MKRRKDFILHEARNTTLRLNLFDVVLKASLSLLRNFKEVLPRNGKTKVSVSFGGPGLVVTFDEVFMTLSRYFLMQESIITDGKLFLFIISLSFTISRWKFVKPEQMVKQGCVNANSKFSLQFEGRKLSK